MADDLKFEFKITDLSDEALNQLAKRVPKATYAAGLTAQKNIVNFMSKPNFGTPIVDTGRLRASISFITQNNQKGGLVRSVAAGEKSVTYTTKKGVLRTRKSKIYKKVESSENDEIKGRANEGELIIGSNVEYAAFVNNGTRKQTARHFMEHGISDHKDEIEQVIIDVLEGNK